MIIKGKRDNFNLKESLKITINRQKGSGKAGEYLKSIKRKYNIFQQDKIIKN